MQDATPIADALDELGAWLWPACADPPASVAARARRLWIDTASCAYAGLRAPELQQWVAAQSRTDAGPVPLPGSASALAASAATTTFAVAACRDEACEGVAMAHGRPGVPIVAALWSAVVAQRPTWRALLAATAAGYEVGARLGARLRIRPGMHVDGAWSAFGAAAALVHLRGGSFADAARAIEACAAQLPYSLYRPVREGANIRNLYLGHSAWLASQAAAATGAGFESARGAVDDFARMALEGAPAGEWRPAGEWVILQSYWKPFAAVRHVHYGAQAALRLRPEIGDTARVDAIRLVVYPEAVQYCGNRNPRTVIQAQFSLSFGVAAALVFGELSPAVFRAPQFDDPGLRRLEALMQVESDAAAFPNGERGARLEISAAQRIFVFDQGPVTGDAGHEPSDEDVMKKFARLTDHDTAMARWAQAVLQSPPDAAAVLPHFPADTSNANVNPKPDATPVASMQGSP